MRYYVVSYDLRGEIGPQDYVRLADALRTAPDFCRALWSFWIVGTPLSPAQIIDRLIAARVIDAGDGIVVLEITGRGDWFGARPPEVARWLSEKIHVA
ncbi:MAG TPA: hypothetical protein VGN74_11635 [Brevundimonas sp.]|jgi:hypothetical protein|uniref:hypothetical protein n=1 Tax=Brevundimonas sp. TaxID=1871086 RepID=UPI002E100FE7|nr:hypothetical protein [Brevundimonas sp.]